MLVYAKMLQYVVRYNSSGDIESKMLHTSLCELLRIRYPIIQAGMADGITTPELVAAVSNAGALGILGASRLPNKHGIKSAGSKQ